MENENAGIEADQVYIVAELAEFLRVSLKTVYRLAESGKIKHMRIGASIRFSGENIIEYLKSIEVKRRDPSPSTPPDDKLPAEGEKGA